jgi:nitrogen fixation/metabolism regulation signal transduction histidine kinase
MGPVAGPTFRSGWNCARPSDQRPNVSDHPVEPSTSRPRRERTLERRLFGWVLVLTLVPALILLAAGGWAVGTSLSVAGALGPWEEVAESGRRVVELAEPSADSALADALAQHRSQLSASLTQARRWAFLGERLQATLPWLIVAVALILAALAAAASRVLARQLARPIHELVTLAELLGRGEPLPPGAAESVREVRVLDGALRRAAAQVAEAQRRAVATERLRVWGEMARRVAHEMKNPLTPLRLAAHRLARSPGIAAESRTSPDGALAQVAEVAEVIDQEVRRLEDLAAQFSALGRPPEGPATEIDLGDLVTSLVETDVPPELAVDVDVAQGLAPVLGHFDGLHRALRNLVRNALEAMADRADGRLGLAVRPLAGPGGSDWIEVRITDNGPGLPPGQEERIFEPDFTTKTRGTGLGLALVRQSVEADGGQIFAANHGHGAEFRIQLPVAARRSHLN